ncbi:MAG: DUF4827 domain-containing protein [Muribaculaceae bacterium]|nr:DUF4827 domain-containing protein [Muribaculaceae bacterium]
MKLSVKVSSYAVSALLMASLSACNDTESYSDMLRDEEYACNWYLSGQKVETTIPADSVFECGSDAPYYRIDEDGYLYMQVINLGDKSQRAKAGDKVYFRFMRQNIKYLYEGLTVIPDGNADNVNNSLWGNTSFVMGNTVLSTSTQWGTGIQMPLDYLGYNSEVNLVMKSSVGFLNDQTQCLPYVINVRYFKAEY